MKKVRGTKKAKVGATGKKVSQLVIYLLSNFYFVSFMEDCIGSA